MQPGFNGRQRNLQYIFNFIIGKTVDISQHKHGAILVRQFLYGIKNSFLNLCSQELQEDYWTSRPEYPLIFLYHEIQWVRHGNCRYLFLFSFFIRTVLTAIYKAKLTIRIPAKTLNLFPRCNKSFLKQILSSMHIA